MLFANCFLGEDFTCSGALGILHKTQTKRHNPSSYIVAHLYEMHLRIKQTAFTGTQRKEQIDS